MAQVQKNSQTPKKAAARKKPSSQKSDEMPDEDTGEKLGWFDRFATASSKIVSRAVFFAFCVALVIVWAPSIVFLHSISTWQLIINTATTIITFLLVALLQNTQERADKAIQEKLNAIADSLASLMKAQHLEAEAKELRAAVGLEKRESSKG